MAFNPRAPFYKLEPLGKDSAPHHDTERTGNARLAQTPMEVARAGYEVLDRTNRTEPFFPFGTQLNPSKAPAIPASEGADPRWDHVGIKIGEL